MRKIHVLVTGSAGFIGSHLVERLSRKCNVRGIDNFSAGTIERPITKNVDLVLNDITSFFKNIDAVFHFAANPDVKLGASNTKIHLEQNIIATHNVLEAMRANDVKKIVFASTSTVYGNAKKIPTPETYSPLEPISLYGASKLACEALISAYCHTFGMQAWIFRLANIIGSKSNHGILPDFIQKLKTDPLELEILGNGEQNKSYLHIEDCVAAILQSFEKADEKINILNIGSEDQIKVRKIANIVCKIMKLNPEYTFTGGREGWKGDVPNMMLDISKIKSLGWRPEYTSEEAVRKTITEIL